MAGENGAGNRKTADSGEAVAEAARPPLPSRSRRVRMQYSRRAYVSGSGSGPATYVTVTVTVPVPDRTYGTVRSDGGTGGDGRVRSGTGPVRRPFRSVPVPVRGSVPSVPYRTGYPYVYR